MTEKCLHPLFIMMMVQITSFKNESWGVKSRSGCTKCLLSDLLWWLTCLLWGESICLHSLDSVQLRYWNICTAFSRYFTSKLPEWAGEAGISCLLKSLFPVSKPMSEDNFLVMATFFQGFHIWYTGLRDASWERQNIPWPNSFLQFSSPVRAHRRWQLNISTGDSRNCRAKVAVI